MLIILNVYFLPISVHSDEGNVPSYIFPILMKFEIINIVLININTYIHTRHRQVLRNLTFNCETVRKMDEKNQIFLC